MRPKRQHPCPLQHGSVTYTKLAKFQFDISLVVEHRLHSPLAETDLPLLLADSANSCLRYHQYAFIDVPGQEGTYRQNMRLKCCLKAAETAEFLHEA